MKHSRVAIVFVALSAVAACKKTRRDECASLRDVMVSAQEKSTVDALASYSGSDRDEIERQSKKELAQFKANFTDACATQDTLDISCIEHQDKPECKQPLETLWKAV